MSTRIAVCSDAHANLPALELALEAIATAGCEVIYHTGDAIGYGPYPAEVLDRLLHTPNMRLLLGNHDEWFAVGLPDPLPPWMSAGEAAHQRWVHAQLDATLRAVVGSWPIIIEQTMDGVSMAFTHYARDPVSGDFAYMPAPNAADLDRLFAGNDADVIFYGHDHMPADLQGRSRYVNPGVLGGGGAPLVRFVIVDVEPDGAIAVQRQAIPYDPADYLRQLVLRDVPERAFIAQAMFGATLPGGGAVP